MSDTTTYQSTARALLPAAAAAFTERVRAVPPERWSEQSPCAEWTVRDVVNHMTYEQRWVPPLLAGKTIAEVGDQFEGDLLGADPVGAWEDAIAAALRSWAMAREDQEVNLSSGPSPAREYAEEMLLDLVVHGWDVARGAGLDERLDPSLVSHVLAYAEPHAEEYAGSGLFGTPVETDRTDDQSRLLAMLGRDP